MAVYQWYANDFNLATDPLSTSDWSFAQGSGVISEIVGITTPIGDRAWQVDSDSSTFTFVNEAVTPGSDTVDVLMLARRESSASSLLGPRVRITEDTGVWSWYAGTVESTNTVHARLAPSGSPSSVTHPDYADLANVWFYIRVRIANTDTVQVKVWLETDPEPEMWTHEATFGSYPKETGQVGIGHWASTVSGREMYVAYYSVGTGVDAAPLPTEENLGLRITDIKEPNEANALVTGVTNARVKVWIGTNDSDWEDEIRSNRVIENGTLEVPVFPEDGFSLNDTVTVEVMWTVGTERKLFITETNVVDLEGGS